MSSNDQHPERLVCLPYCIGKEIDVGCGNRKTSDNCIGVDILPKGQLGWNGCMFNVKSVADICTSGDKLSMFDDESLDFVVARHNLEHYVDIFKTLFEWKRVLKKGGLLIVILPDEEGLRKVGKRGILLDNTHEHSFTKQSFKTLIELFNFTVVRLQTVIQNWSFICVGRKEI